MIRRAVGQDLARIEKIYGEIIRYEQAHVKYTTFCEGIYPTKSTAEQALARNDLYVCEREREVCGSIILNHSQPEEYGKIDWKIIVLGREVGVIHLLCAHPAHYGKGEGNELLSFAEDWARGEGCKALRLDTGVQNLAARKLYERNGFSIAGRGAIRLGGLVEHSGHLFYEKRLYCDN